MDVGHLLVGLLTVILLVLLTLVEIRSRRNSAAENRAPGAPSLSARKEPKVP